MGKFEYSIDYSLISIGKSWIFINPSHGCNLGCGYCIEQKDKWFEKNIKNEFSIKETLEKLINSQLILKDKTPLSFFNYSDPFLNKNKIPLIKILSALDKKGWKNKVGLISKIHPGENYLDSLKNLENLKIGVFVSYANLISGLESVSDKQRIRLMEDAKDRDIKVVAYVRPLVREWTNEKRLTNLAYQIKGKVDAASLSGIRLTPEIVKSLKIKRIPIPEIKTYSHKQRDDELSFLATQIIGNVAQIPVFWHTSCAMSYLFGEPDYNSHDIREKRKKEVCSFPCINSQRDICNSRKCDTNDNELEKILVKLGKETSYRREEETFLLSGNQLNREDISFIRHIIPEFVIEDE